MAPGKSNEPLTLNEFQRRGYLDALAEVFGTTQAARPLLDRIDFPNNLRPQQAANANEFWYQVCSHIANGLTEGGLPAALAAAAHLYPHNATFRSYGQWHANRPVTNEEARSGSSLFVFSTMLPAEILGRLRRLAELHNTPGPIRLAVTSETGLVGFDLPGATGEQAQTLVEALRAELARGPGPVRIRMATNEHRETMLNRLLVSGPDDTRFELENVPANTPPRDIARAIMDQYTDPTFWPRDPATGKPRQATITRVDGDGKRHRLEPDAPIGHQQVSDGDSLSVAPEARAGSINPILRNEALARVRAEVVAFATSRPGIGLSANEAYTPTEYVLTFSAPSWGPPDAPGLPPTPIDRHEVFLLLPPDFPVVAPAVFWRSRIYHPNIEPKSGAVCLGALADLYRPGLNFGELCQILLDMAAYRNYETREGYNLEAQKWAMSAEGQRAIESRGGHSLTRQVLRDVAVAQIGHPTFSIRRVNNP